MKTFSFGLSTFQRTGLPWCPGELGNDRTGHLSLYKPLSPALLPPLIFPLPSHQLSSPLSSSLSPLTSSPHPSNLPSPLSPALLTTLIFPLHSHQLSSPLSSSLSTLTTSLVGLENYVQTVQFFKIQAFRPTQMQNIFVNGASGTCK